jgi:hypothetical protein
LSARAGKERTRRKSASEQRYMGIPPVNDLF